MIQLAFAFFLGGFLLLLGVRGGNPIAMLYGVLFVVTGLLA